MKLKIEKTLTREPTREELFAIYIRGNTTIASDVRKIADELLESIGYVENSYWHEIDSYTKQHTSYIETRSVCDASKDDMKMYIAQLWFSYYPSDDIFYIGNKHINRKDADEYFKNHAITIFDDK